MISKDDIIKVEVTEKMLFDAVNYAEKSLHFTFNRMGKKDPYERVRNIVKGLIMEGAFKRLLDHHKVPYDLLGNTHWTKKDRYDVGMNGHKYDIKGCYISEFAYIKAIQEDVAWLLDCSALVPSDQINGVGLKQDDFYVFTFMTGKFDSSNIRELFKLNRYKYLIHVFWDYAWIKNKGGKGLGKLTINSELDKKLNFRIGGQDENGENIIEEFVLNPDSKAVTKNNFFTVLFTQTHEIPEANLIVRAEKLNKSEKIEHTDWRNIWVYDGIVYFTGLLSKKEFKENSQEIPRFYKGCKQYKDTLTINREMLINALDPISALLPKVFDKTIFGG